MRPQPSGDWFMCCDSCLNAEYFNISNHRLVGLDCQPEGYPLALFGFEI